MTQRRISARDRALRDMPDPFCKSLRLLKVITPVTWGLCFIAIIPSILIFLRPSLTEFLSFYALQLALLPPTNFLTEWAFLRLNPDTAAYIGDPEKRPNLNERVESANLQERVALLESLFSFPERFARFAYIGSFVTNIPAFFMLLFIWEHEQPIWLRLTLVLCATAINLGYFYGAVFFDSHQAMSKLISDLHKSYDFSGAFQRLKVPYSKDNAHIRELIVFGYLVVFIFAFQALVVLNDLYSSPADLAMKLALIDLTGLLLFAHVWHTARKYLVGGLEVIFQRMEVLDFSDTRTTLPLHTSRLLANFEETVNTLSRRLRSSEQELRSMIDQEAEKSRFRALGEMSALIAHDMSGPLHVAQFCVHELLREPKKVSVITRYLKQLSTNLEKAIELINSLRARIKNPVLDSSNALFDDAHKNVLRLLGTQFPREEFDKVQVSFDGRLESLILPIPRVDLIHVLDNLYRNSFENMIRFKIEAPKLRIELDASTDGYVTILIADTGSSLSVEDYDRLTGPAPAKTGLGLRLTRRLVELYGGTLSVVPRLGQPGTVFRLQFPKSEPAKPGMTTDLKRNHGVSPTEIRHEA